MMRMLFLLLLIAPASMPAQNDRSQQCSSVASVSLPPESETTKPSVFPTCEAYKSYAGIGRPVNYAATRACAWRERTAQQAGLPQNPKAPAAWAIGGDLILVNLYANGLGTPRNLSLALHLACEENSGIAADAIDDLDKFSKAAQLPTKRFEVCDSAASTFSMNFCESYQNEIAGERRNRAIRRLEAQWTPEQKAAFAKVEAAEEEYVSAHGKELDQGGTIRALREMGSAEIMHKNFLLDLRQLERGDLPKNRGAEAAEKRMMQQYKANLAEARKPIAAGDENSAVTADGVAEAQDAWRRYRDAWLAFAAVRYSTAPVAAFRGYFAEERYRLLVEMGKQIYRDSN